MSTPNSTPTKEDRIGELAAEWLAENSGRPVRMSQGDAYEIIYRLILAGVHPTIEAIRRVNGGSGSPNVIHPFLAQFYAEGELEKRWQAPQPSEALPEAIQALWASALQLARQHIARTNEKRQAELEDRAAQIDAFQESLLERERTLAVREEGLRSELEATMLHHDEFKVHTANEIARVVSESASTQARLDSEIADLKGRLVAMTSEFDRASSASIDLARKHEMASLAKDRLAADLAEVTRANRVLLESKATLTSERDALQGQISATEGEVRHLRETIEAQRTEAASALDSVRKDAQHQLELARQEVDSQREKLASSTAAAISAQERLAELKGDKHAMEKRFEVENTALRKERDLAIQKLDSAMHDLRAIASEQARWIGAKKDGES